MSFAEDTAPAPAPSLAPAAATETPRQRGARIRAENRARAAVRDKIEEAGHVDRDERHRARNYFSEANIAQRVTENMASITEACRPHEDAWRSGLAATLSGRKIADVILPCCEEKPQELACAEFAGERDKQACCKQAAYRGMGVLARGIRDERPDQCLAPFNGGIATGARACALPEACIPEVNARDRWSFCRYEAFPSDRFDEEDIRAIRRGNRQVRARFTSQLGTRFNGCRQAGFVASFCSCLPEIRNVVEASGGTPRSGGEMGQICNWFSGFTHAAQDPQLAAQKEAEAQRARGAASAAGAGRDGAESASERSPGPPTGAP